MLRGDTTAPSGLYARLCHAFLVISVLLIILTMDTMSEINLMDGWMDILWRVFNILTEPVPYTNVFVPYVDGIVTATRRKISVDIRIFFAVHTAK